MNISWSDLAVIYTALIGITAVLLVVANWRIKNRKKKEDRNQ